MEFLSPKTKERISKLEAENGELQRQLIEQKGSSSKKFLAFNGRFSGYYCLGNVSVSRKFVHE